MQSTRVLDCFFMRVASTQPNEYKYFPSTEGFEYKYEYSKNGAQVVFEYKYRVRVL